MRHTTHHQRAAYEAMTRGDAVSARLHWLIAATYYRTTPGEARYAADIRRSCDTGAYTQCYYRSH